ncbi:uncharacterized protein LOC135200751 [Macrobrachium nipponense]|uniref:uncharacterized protein LOC135200751 n=1 Tax=Macrobrachium nipponense TaxID=159736 RepID=UPI0030C845F5
METIKEEGSKDDSAETIRVNPKEPLQNDNDRQNKSNTQRHLKSIPRNVDCSSVQVALGDPVRNVACLHRQESSSKDGETSNCCKNCEPSAGTSYYDDCSNKKNSTECSNNNGDNYSSSAVADICSNLEAVSRSTAFTARAVPTEEQIEGGDQINHVRVVSEARSRVPCGSSNYKDNHTREMNDAKYKEGCQSGDYNRINQCPSSSRSLVSSYNQNSASVINISASSCSEISRSPSTISLNSPAAHSEDGNPPFVSSCSSEASNVALREGSERLSPSGYRNAGPSLGNGAQRAPRVFHIQPIQLNPPPIKPIKCTCQYRSPFLKLSPPCYFCSTTDRPPKYRETDGFDWRRAKGRLFCVVKTLGKKNRIQQDASSSSDFCEMNDIPFTISDGRMQGPSNNNHGESLPSPCNSNNLSIASHESQIHTDDIQRAEVSITESADDRCPQQRRIGSLSGNNNGSLALRTVSSDPPPYFMGGTGIPPPYSPPTPSSFPQYATSESWTSNFHWQHEYDFTQVEFGRNCRCNIIYSFLLGTITTVVIFGTDPPVPLLSCAIIFFTFLVYMPLLWFLENFVRWRPWGSLQERMAVFAARCPPRPLD